MADIQEQQHFYAPDDMELDQLIEQFRASFLTTATMARLYVPRLRLLLKDRTAAPRGIDLFEHSYQQPKSPSVLQLKRPFAADFSWPAEHVPSSSTANTQAPWIEETCDPFTYPDLPDGHTRLLELQPSVCSDDPIRCRLHHKPLDNLPDFEVLSCTGAQVSMTLPITIDDKSFDVPVALWDALHQIRRQDQSRFLWLDQVFENPSEATDREQNARLKNYIYQRATLALVWLGVDDEDSQLVFTHLEDCRARNRLNWEDYKGQTKKAFHMLCRRQWFHRLDSALLLATCREVVLLCGSNVPCTVPELVKCTPFKSEYHPLHGIHGPNHLQILIELAEQRHIQRALRFCQYVHSTRDGSGEPFEILNELCGMGLPISPDLSHNLTVKAITDRQDIAVLHWAAAGHSRSPGTPSWVPTLLHSPSLAPLPRNFGSFSYRDEYPWTLLPGWRAGSDGSLSLKGYFCGKVAATGMDLTLGNPGTPVLSIGRFTEAFVKVISSWEEVCVNHLGKPGKKRFWQPLANAFADTIRAEDTQEQNEPYTERPGMSVHAGAFLEWYRQYGSGLLAKHEPEYFDTLETAKTWVAQIQPEVDHGHRTRESYDYYTENVERAIFGRRFFVTDDGSMGLAPGDAQTGDQLIFFPGGRYAFVVRTREDGRGYELLGDCFSYDLNVFRLGKVGKIQNVVLV